MVLDFNKEAIDRFQRRKFTATKGEVDTLVVNEGFALTSLADFTVGEPEEALETLGYGVTITLLNKSASRTCTITITNQTQGIVLASGDVTLGDGEFYTQTFFWSLEDITPGNVVRFSFGGDGVGTAVDSNSFATIISEIKSYFEIEDEST